MVQRLGLLFLLLALVMYAMGLNALWPLLALTLGVVMISVSIWRKAIKQKLNSIVTVENGHLGDISMVKKSENRSSDITKEKEINPMASKLTEEINVVIDLDLASFAIGAPGQPSLASVPPHQVFVLSHGYEMYDQSGFPEVYLAGETLVKSRRRKDIPALVIQLDEYPGAIRSTLRQRLVGISVSEEDVGTLDFYFPLYLHDPIQTIRRTGKLLTQPNSRQQVNTEFVEQLTRRLQDAFSDRIQIWSAEKTTVLERLSQALETDLKEWGLRINPETISMVRYYPHNLYEVVLQFARAEQEILDAITPDEKDALLRTTGLSLDDVIFIRSVMEQNNATIGAGLFLKIREKKLTGNSEMREKMVKWLSNFASSVAAEFVNSLYSGKYSEVDISLSEQVVLASIRNPMLALGEYLVSTP